MLEYFSSDSDRNVIKELITVPLSSSHMESTNNSFPADQGSVGTKEESPNLVEERAERAEENWSLRRGYEGVDFHVRDYLSQYRWSIFCITCRF